MIPYISFIISMIPFGNILDSIIKLGLIGSIITISFRLLDSYNKKKHAKEKYFEVYKNLKDIIPSDFNIAEYRDYYYNRKENDLILETLSNSKNVIITGKPKSGKTRAAYESLRKLNGFKIIKFWSNRPIELEVIPNNVLKNRSIFKSRIIVFIDDLDKYINKLNINQLSKKFDLTTKEFIIVATCRTGLEYKNVKKEFNESINDFKEINLGDINENIAKDLSTNFKLNFEDFDGTVGSLFLGLTDMKERYEGLSDEYHVLFRIIKLFADSDSFIIDKNALKAVYLEKIKGEIFPNISYETLIETLEDNSLLIEKTGNIKVTHDSYLEFAGYNATITDLKWLREILIKINNFHGLFNLGNSFFYKKLYDEALICFNAILKTSPDYLTLNNKGITLDSLGNFQEAIKCFDEAIDLDPYEEKAFKGRGDVLQKMGKLEEAIKCYNKSLEINPNYYLGFISKGSLLADLGSFDEALKCFDNAIRINPTYSIAFFNKGVVFMDMGRSDEALDYFDKALKRDPNDWDTLIAKGTILMDIKRSDEALDYFNKAIQINNANEIGNEKSLYNKAAILITLNKENEALACYDKVLDINPNNENALYNKGNILLKLNKENEALRCYDKVLDINPNNNMALVNKGSALNRIGKSNEAIICYDELLKLYPNNIAVLFNKGNAFCILEKWKDAIESYDKVLKLNPKKNPSKTEVLNNKRTALINQALLLANLEKYHEALEYYEKSLKIDPNDIKVLEYKGILLGMLGKVNEAINCFNVILKLEPNNTKMWHLKGELFLDIKNYPEALKCFDKLLKIDPKNNKARCDKGFCLEKLGKILEALKCYDKVLEIDHNYTDAYYSRGIAFLRLDNYPEALNGFNKTLELDPDNIAAWCNKGFILEEMEKIPEAVECFDNALNIDPNCEPALNAKKNISEN